MANYSLIPSWNQVANMYPYAPGRGNQNNDEWTAVKKAAKKSREIRANERAAQRAARRDELALSRSFENAAEENDRIWEEAVPTRMISDRGELPERNIDILFGDVEPKTETYKKLKAEYPNVYNLFRPMAYLSAAYEQPQNVPEAIMSGLRDWLRIPNFSRTSKEEKADLDTWFDEYLASGGAGTGGGYAPDVSMMGSPFPEIAGYVPDWEAIKKARDIKAPEYKEEAFNPMNTIASMLMNADWINMDMSRSAKVMQDAFNHRAKNNADTYNANEEARYSAARQNLATQLAIENLRVKQAANAAELAIARWQAMQPKALGGNKLSWRDSAGNLHFEQVDKQGEARTLGSNEAIAMLAALDEKKLKNLTPEKIVQMAKKQSLLLQDKAAQVPWMQGYILQANEALNSRKEK